MTERGKNYKHASTTIDERTLRVERVFEAPRELGWRAFSEPDLVAQWWCRGNKVDVERWKFEKGGHWRLVEHWNGGSMGFEGRFREITPKTLISYTFDFDALPGHPSIETNELSDENGGLATRLVVTTLFFTKEDCDGMAAAGAESGMAQSYAALDALLERM